MSVGDAVHQPVRWQTHALLTELQVTSCMHSHSSILLNLTLLSTAHASQKRCIERYRKISLLRIEAERHLLEV